MEVYENCIAKQRNAIQVFGDAAVGNTIIWQTFPPILDTLVNQQIADKQTFSTTGKESQE